VSPICFRDMNVSYVNFLPQRHRDNLYFPDFNRGFGICAFHHKVNKRHEDIFCFFLFFQRNCQLLLLLLLPNCHCYCQLLLLLPNCHCYCQSQSLSIIRLISSSKLIPTAFAAIGTRLNAVIPGKVLTSKK